jgi:hypothetical protein
MQTNTSSTSTTQAEPGFSQRRGKIARLPRDIRDQLNTRLDDAQEADDILPWLNSLPKVQEVIAKLFNGVPVSPQNLSAWRQGGFQEWLLHRQLFDTAAHVRENLEEMSEALGSDALGYPSPEDVPLLIANQMLAQLTLRFNAFLASWSGGPIEDHLAMTLKLGQFLMKLQQSVYNARRQAIELPELVRKAERQYEREIMAELFQEQMAAPRKESAQSEEKPKKPAPKNDSSRPTPQPASQPAPAPGQSSPIKPNQASREPSSNKTSAPTIVPLPAVGRVP